MESRKKVFKLEADQIKPLLPDNMGGSMATDKITVDGEPITVMFRQEPAVDEDNGWIFLSGTETPDYLDNADNWSIYAINTIANYDPAIIPYLDQLYGTELHRVSGTDLFEVVEGDNSLFDRE